MSDLISRKALIKEVENSKKVNPHNGKLAKEMHNHEHNHFLCMLSKQPTVDAVEVVRCKDCESYIPGKRSCKSEYLNGYTIPNGYCFNGVRKKV